MFTWLLDARLSASRNYYYPDLSEGADRVGGQLCWRQRVPLQWRNQIRQSLRKVPESNARSMGLFCLRFGVILLRGGGLLLQ